VNGDYALASFTFEGRETTFSNRDDAELHLRLLSNNKRKMNTPAEFYGEVLQQENSANGFPFLAVSKI